MITKIGIVSGDIIDLLDQNDGALVFDQIYSSLKQPRDLVFMSLGWLLRENYVYILENPSTVTFQKDDSKKTESCSVNMSDLIVRNNAVGLYGMRIKNIHDQIDIVTGKILTILEGCGGLLDLRTIESNLKDQRDIVLMGLGWSIRSGYTRGIDSPSETFICRLPRKMSNIELGVNE